MNDMTSTSVATRPADIDAAEWALRVQLAAAYRLVDHFGWTELIYGHLTARVAADLPAGQAHFLINPWGLNFDEITASNLVKIDLDGNPVVAAGAAGSVASVTPPINYAGFIIHSAVHMAHTAHSHVVMHTHTVAGMAVAALADGLLPVSMFATAFHENVGYHDYEGASLYPDERERFVASLGAAKALILRNHGLLVVGSTVTQAQAPYMPSITSSPWAKLTTRMTPKIRFRPTATIA